jgi:hypothetical protein
MQQLPAEQQRGAQELPTLLRKQPDHQTGEARPRGAQRRGSHRGSLRQRGRTKEQETKGVENERNTGTYLGSSRGAEEPSARPA